MEIILSLGVAALVISILFHQRKGANSMLRVQESQRLNNVERSLVDLRMVLGSLEARELEMRSVLPTLRSDVERHGRVIQILSSTYAAPKSEPLNLVKAKPKRARKAKGKR